jgi:hypothetical protein
MKGIALFATLIGVYQWLGTGTSLYDIMVILLATYLIISIDAGKPTENPKRDEAQQIAGDNAERKAFFLKAVNPLKELVTRATNSHNRLVVTAYS